MNRFLRSFSICKSGVWFYYKGDEVLLKFPWKKGLRYVSLLASGTGEFGDAEFISLKEMDKFWREFNVL